MEPKTAPGAMPKATPAIDPPKVTPGPHFGCVLNIFLRMLSPFGMLFQPTNTKQHTKYLDAPAKGRPKKVRGRRRLAVGVFDNKRRGAAAGCNWRSKRQLELAAVKSRDKKGTLELL